jgi:tetratricopeptide (TPR) repeat protein
MMRLFITLMLCTCLSLSVWAEEKIYLLSEKVYKVLSDAQQRMAEGQHAEAEKKLNGLLGQVDSGSYDYAVIQQTLGYLFADKTNYAQATKAFQKALDSQALPPKVSDDLRYNLAQLLIADGQYQQGIQLMETWLKTADKPDTAVYVLLATAHYQIEQYQPVVEYMKKAISRDADAKEDWYRLLLSAYLSLKQNKAASGVLETLITRYPHREIYWQQLSAIYLQRDLELRSLAVKMLADRLDMRDAKTLVNLSDMYRYLHIPFKSGQLLQSAMDEGLLAADFKLLDKLASSWLAAREADKAADTLQKMLSMDDSGETHLRLGQVYVATEQWKKATEALEAAPKAIRSNGQLNMLLGTSYFHLADYAQAKVAFGKALSNKDNSGQAAQWLRHIDDVLEKQTNEQTS